MTFQIYKSADGYRWRLRAKNRNVIAESPKPYQRKAHCERIVRQIQEGAYGAMVVEI